VCVIVDWLMLMAGITGDDVEGGSADVHIRSSASVREDARGDCDGRSAEWPSEASHRRLGEKRRSA